LCHNYVLELVDGPLHLRKPACVVLSMGLELQFEV